MDLKLARSLSQLAGTKIVLLVADGLGGLPDPASGRSELETARTPHLDGLAARSALGATLPVGHGITPGSGPGHLSLFGYDPLQVQIGRGALEAVGIDFALGANDVAARGNLCTLDTQGRISDRRAGRISTERAAELVDRLRAIDLGPDVELFVEPVRDHRFVLVLRGSGLSDAVEDTDPQRTGAPPLVAQARVGGEGSRGAEIVSRVAAQRERTASIINRMTSGGGRRGDLIRRLASGGERGAEIVGRLTSAGERTANLINQFVDAALLLLVDAAPANGLLLRGFSNRPALPQLADVWQLQAASCALYPMYRGLATLTGMQALPAGSSFSDQIASVRLHWAEHDFFFIHYKFTDTAGEDGDFAAKVQRLEELDAQIPALLDLNPDVFMITGDHSTPAVMAAHSWHPVPFLLHGPHVRFSADAAFDEQHCARGSLGIFPAKEGLPLAMAHAGRLAKFGA